MKEISIDGFYDLVQDNENLDIIDVRTKEQFDSGHIPGAIHIPLSELENHLDQLDEETHYYTICQRGIKSKEAAKILDQHQFDVTYVNAGMPDYPGKLEK